MFCCEYRWHPRSVLRLATVIWVRWLPTRVKLPLSGWLRGSRQAVARDNMSVARLQNQIPGEFLLAKREPRVRLHQSHLRILRWMQTTVQHQVMENIHRLFQLFTRRRHRRRENLLLPRRFEPRPAEYGTDQTYHAAHRRARPGLALWFTLVRSWQGHDGLGREWPWCQFHVWCRGESINHILLSSFIVS